MDHDLPILCPQLPSGIYPRRALKLLSLLSTYMYPWGPPRTDYSTYIISSLCSESSSSALLSRSSPYSIITLSPSPAASFVLHPSSDVSVYSTHSLGLLSRGISSLITTPLTVRMSFHIVRLSGSLSHSWTSYSLLIGENPEWYGRTDRWFERTDATLWIPVFFTSARLGVAGIPPAWCPKG